MILIMMNTHTEGSNAPAEVISSQPLTSSLGCPIGGGIPVRAYDAGSRERFIESTPSMR